MSSQNVHHYTQLIHIIITSEKENFYKHTIGVSNLQNDLLAFMKVMQSYIYTSPPTDTIYILKLGRAIYIYEGIVFALFLFVLFFI